MNINSTSSEAPISPGSLLVLLHCHILPASCVLKTHMELSGGPAHGLGYSFLIHKFIFQTISSFLGTESAYYISCRNYRLAEKLQAFKEGTCCM